MKIIVTTDTWWQEVQIRIAQAVCKLYPPHKLVRHIAVNRTFDMAYKVCLLVNFIAVRVMVVIALKERPLRGPNKSRRG